MKAEIKKQAQYKKVGRLRKPIADQIRRKAADIYINDNHLVHIFNRHRVELSQIGLEPRIFVDLVVNGFNRIYRGKDKSLLLVLWNDKPRVTAIELNFSLGKGFYEVKTATVMRKEFFNNSNLLWQKKRKELV